MKLAQLGWWLVVIGSINWGLVGLGALIGTGNWNVVHALLSSMPQLENIVYVLVGVGGVMMLTKK